MNSVTSYILPVTAFMSKHILTSLFATRYDPAPKACAVDVGEVLDVHDVAIDHQLNSQRQVGA